MRGTIMKVPDIASLIRATDAAPSLRGRISDEAIHTGFAHDGLLRFARNDGGDTPSYRYSAACCVGASSTSSTFGGDIGSA